MDTDNINQPLPLEKYKEFMDIVPITTVDVLFFNRDMTETLLFKRKNEPLKEVYFSLGGSLKKNETLIDGAVRQAFRETGVYVNKDLLFYGGTQDEIHPNSSFEGISYHAVDSYFGYILEKEEIILDFQHSEYKWFSISDETLHHFIKTKIKNLLKAYEQKL
jgi:ADP-ribose pyrophosphatase YjhB (NUDIX family)